MPLSLNGPQQAAPHTAPTVPALLDVDLPVLDSAGITTLPGGDYKLTGEVATVEKVIWATVLTPAGSLDWDPDFGTRLRHKRLRPIDLASERRRLTALVLSVPHVRQADVQLLFGEGELVVKVYAVTDFGELETSRPIAEG